MRDVEAARDLRLCLQAHARNRDLHAFARAFVEAYERASSPAAFSTSTTSSPAPAAS
jgi:hypothetical protein